MWSSFGRHFFHEDSETNNLVERFFLAVKNHFLNVYCNRRLDDLLLLLSNRVLGYYRYIDSLQKAGRLNNPRTTKEMEGKRKAEELVHKGWVEKCHWKGDFTCLMPSSTTENLWYTVVLPEYTCECISACWMT
ncbi:hypothetical protein AOXY_G746 [Acipenser oxyrinchus oxyrinchus]|uniref:Transposase n=1 Tax=Acipenser oxyrinchus oxyrinchus TaxID=40147 RepID=A0AAD8GKC0_ACIOX|nr:hypothetical protein AOXY_G746 [Acipenser oxyrinchus oxyrinchus]